MHSFGDTTEIWFSLRWNVRFNKHLTKLFELFWASNFFCEKRELNDVEKFIIKFVSFRKIFLLHLLANTTMFAIGRCKDITCDQKVSSGQHTFLWEEKLVDDDIVRVDLISGQFLNQSLGFVERQELGNANADERRLFLKRKLTKLTDGAQETYRIFELSVDFSDDPTHGLQFREHILLRTSFTSHHTRHLRLSYNENAVSMYSNTVPDLSSARTASQGSLISQEPFPILWGKTKSEGYVPWARCQTRSQSIPWILHV